MFVYLVAKQMALKETWLMKCRVMRHFCDFLKPLKYKENVGRKKSEHTKWTSGHSNEVH